ncbi:MAG: hypothetical protein WED11_03970, partial [Natronospirillum sp.]
MGVLRDATATAMERWILARNPASGTVALGQKHIFIMPNRYGIGLLMLVLLLFLMGTNYQNNLVLALAFWLLSVFILSILLTYHNLSGLRLNSGHGVPGHAQTPIKHSLTLHSERDRYGVLLTGQVVPGNGVMVSVHYSTHWFERLMAGSARSLSLNCIYRHRGKHSAPRVRLETRFPFGWITA